MSEDYFQNYPKVQYSDMWNGKQVVFRGETPKEVIDLAKSEEGQSLISKVKQ